MEKFRSALKIPPSEKQAFGKTYTQDLSNVPQNDRALLDCSDNERDQLESLASEVSRQPHKPASKSHDPRPT